MLDTLTMPVDFGIRPRRGSTVWQCHLPIPPELRHLYGGKRELRKSLDTRDRTEAESRARELCVEVFAKYERQLRGLNPERVETLTPALVAALVAAIQHDILTRDDLARFDLPGGPGLRAAWKSWDFDEQEAEGGPTLSDALAEVHEMIADGLRATLAAGDDEAAQAIADEAARKYLGKAVAWDRPENRPALIQCLQAAVDAWNIRTARDRGDTTKTPPKPEAPKTPEKPKPAPRLRDALEPWKASNPDRNPKYVRAMERTLAAFETVTANPALVDLTRAQGDDFRSWLLEQNEEPKTAADKLNAIKSLLNYAADVRGLLPRNPWSRLSIKAPKGGKRTPWTADELGKLFGSPIFTAYHLPSVEAAGADAAYFVPLLALFSGARVSELCQLRVADIGREDGPDGPGSVPVFRITRAKADAEADTKATKAKTDGSVRLVPIHAELIRLGFLDYVKAIKATGAGQLFPAVKRYRDETGEGAGSALSTWFGEYRGTVGVAREFAGLHAARHTMRTALHVQARATDRQAFAIGGWTAPGVRSAGNETYLHEDTTPAALQAAINRVEFPGLNLPRVFKAPAWTPTTSADSLTNPARRGRAVAAK